MSVHPPPVSQYPVWIHKYLENLGMFSDTVLQFLRSPSGFQALVPGGDSGPSAKLRSMLKTSNWTLSAPHPTSYEALSKTCPSPTMADRPSTDCHTGTGPEPAQACDSQLSLRPCKGRILTENDVTISQWQVPPKETLMRDYWSLEEA